ncbi:MAG: hypothetical protein AAF958_07985 [Planctomycetota bacterium]
MSSPSVLLITSNRAIGYSPSRKGTPVTSIPADASGDIGLSIEALLAAMPGRQRQVFVLTTEVWSQAVAVESRSLRRIEKSQIGQMLAFEAESFSGIPASSARTAFDVLNVGPLETTYWISQIDATRFAQAADAIAFNGGKLLGIGHPCGLPSPLRPSRGDWTRLECWDDFTVVVSKEGRSAITRRFVGEMSVVPPTSAAARQTLESIGVTPQSFVEVLDATSDALSSAAEEFPPAPVESGQPASVQAGGGQAAGGEGAAIRFDSATDTAADFGQDAANAELATSVGVATSVGEVTASLSVDQDVASLGNPADLEAFLDAWSRSLKRSKSAPVITPVRPRASAQTRRQLVLAGLAASVVGVAAHYNYDRVVSTKRVSELAQQVQELQVPIEQFNAKEKELRDLDAEIKATTAKRDDLEIQVARYRGQLGIHRSRMAKVLNVLSKQTPEDLMIFGVRSDGENLRVTGRSLRSDPIIRFAQSIAEELATMNLSIAVPRREALLYTSEGGPFEFEYLISDGV